jgi:hypothetical protein
MWKMIVEHLPLFGPILGGGILFSAILMGLYDSLYKVCGVKTEISRKVSYAPLVIALYALIGGIIYLILANEGIVSKGSVISGLFIGGLVGIVIIGLYLWKDWVLEELGFAVGGIAGLIAGGIADGIVGETASEIAGLIAGLIGGWIVGVIVIIFIGISQLISKPFYILLTLIIVLLRYRKTFCTKCFHFSKPLKSIYESGIRYCERCGSTNFLEGVNKVIGIVGGFKGDYHRDEKILYINLWSEGNVRDADIHELWIRKIRGDVDYEAVIEKIVMELKRDAARPANWLKKVRVIIKGNPPLSTGAMRILKQEFKEVIREE